MTKERQIKLRKGDEKVQKLQLIPKEDCIII